LAKIPNVVSRLECLHVRATFAGKAGSLGATLDLFSKAVAEIKQSRSLNKYLEVVLKIGNALNSGSFRGGAYGYKLDSLIKMADVRSSNKDTPTLLHYIAAKSETDYPDLLGLSKEFADLHAAAKESFSQIGVDLAALDKGLKLIEAQIKKAEGGGIAKGDGEKEKETDKPQRASPRGPLPNDPFIVMMKQFYDRASKAHTNLANKLKSLEGTLKEMLEFYGEDSSTTPEGFLVTVSRAVSLFDKAIDDNVKRRAAAAKAEEAERRRERLKKNVAAKAPAEAGGAAGGPSDRNVMDNLIGQLHTGDAFVGRAALRKAQPGPGAAPPAKGEGGQMANEALAIFAKMKSKREN